MKALFKIVNKHFWKSVTGPIFAFILPSILLFFIGLIMGYGFSMPGVVTIPILTIGLVFMPQSIFEFKNSSLLKRISITPISAWKFLFVIFVFNFTIIIFGIIIQFILSFAIFHEFLYEADPKFNFENSVGEWVPSLSYLESLKVVDWFGFIYSIILMIALTMLFGIAIVSIANSTIFIISTGISVILITMFLAPTVLPIQMVGQIEAIKYIGYAWPLKYPMGTLIESFNGAKNGIESINNITGSTIWDINQNYIIFNSFGYQSGSRTIIYFQKIDKILNLTIPYFLMIFLGFLTMSKFSWTTRTKKTFHLTNIYNKKTKSINTNNFHLKGDANSKYILEAHNITKEFKIQKTILKANDDISIKFKRGENVAILGGNGAGKTTFIEMLLGINNPTSGHFTYNYEYKTKFNQYLGVQFQDASYPVGLKCKDIITFFKEVYNIKTSNDELNKMIEEFGIKKFYNRNASSLSGGQQQRLNLMLSILHKPKIIFLDELSTGLDISIRNSIKEFIKKYAKENNILLIVISHDVNEVDYLCDKIIVFKEGKIVANLSKDEILKKNKNIEEFITKYLK